MWSRLMLSSAAVAASVVVGSALALDAAAPLSAQTRAARAVSLTDFMDRLSFFGRCEQNPKWGYVWQPDAGPNFRPYFYGYWQNTADYGWFWVSNEPYGDIVYHYGRWVFEPGEGWLWVPGYVFGPSWVVWREGEGDVGWLPMPPRYADFDTGAGTEGNAGDDSYGYRTLYGGDFVSNRYPGLWTFVQTEDFGRSGRRRYVTDQKRLREFLQASEDRTAYRIDRDRIVDRSLEGRVIGREAPRETGVATAARFLRRDAVLTSVSEGREILQRERNRVGAELCPAPGATASKQPEPGGEAARRALSSLPPHGATPLRPFYPGVQPVAPLSEPLRQIQRQSRRAGTPEGQIPQALRAPSLEATPPLSDSLRDIQRFSGALGTRPP